MTYELPTSTALGEHLLAAREAWPSLRWHDDEYVRWLREQLQSAAEPVTQLAKADPRVAVLCWLAARGDGEAIRLFELHYMPHVAVALARFRADDSFVDEVAQRVRMKFLVSKPEQLAPIDKYALGGSLSQLVRVAAVREACTMRRLDKPMLSLDAIDELPGDQDPALRALKVRYAADFERSFRAAVAALSSRDRQMLRLSLSMKASIDDIARILQTHRATAARWLIAAREALAVATRQRLQTDLGLADDELDSVLRLVRSEATRMLDSIPPSQNK